MKLTRVIAAAVIAASGALGVAQAQSLKNSGEPAEFPPSTYKGRQYVDSKGCVYIRAGIDGNVTWVPRVSRSRNQVCGFQPTNAGTRAAQVARQPAPQPEPTPTATATAARTTASTAATSTAASTTVRRSTNVAAQPRVVAQPVRRTAPVLVRPVAQPTPVVTTAPRTVVATAPRVVTTTTQRRVATTRTSCPGVTGISAQYMGSSRYNVRCGPQAESPHGGVRIATAPAALAPAAAAPQAYVPRTYATGGHGQATRIAPRHVYEQQQAANVGNLHIPDGYKRVWMDDRLNPRRAHQTFAGKDQMDLIWTRTVPRKLIVRRTGRVVTRDYPGLVYPYTSYDQMYQAQGYGSGYGAGDGSGTHISTRGSAPEPASARKVQSTVKAAPAATTQRASHSYVQAGVYKTRAQAATEAQRLARTGVTTRLGTLTKGGKTYSLVLAGPFRTQAQLNSALATARAAGFGNARLRK